MLNGSSTNALLNGKKTTCVACQSRCDSIFSGMTADQLEIFEANHVVNRYPRGQAIFYEGNVPIALYCLASGKVKLSKMGEHGKQQILRVAKSSDVLGYRSLLLNKPYQATAEALEDATVCVIPRVAFFEWLNTSISFNRKLLDRMAKDLGDEEQRLLEMVDTPAPQRLARTLLTLSRKFGKTIGKSVELEVPLTREEIGEIIGTTLETTIRMLSALKKRGVVSLGRRRIVIQDLARLARIAENGETGD